MDYNKFNIEEKYDSYKNITIGEAERILSRLEDNKALHDNYDINLLRGKMYLKLGNLKEAIEQLESALKYKESDEVYDLLSFAYFEDKNLDKALFYINLSFGITVDEYIYNHKGKILEQLGRWEESFEIYYNGLKFALGTYSSYGDVEIFGENVARVGGILKNKYLKAIRKCIKDNEPRSLYENYVNFFKVISMEEENDHYHSANEYIKFNYLELLNEGKYILIDNNYFLEMINIYKILYEIENNSEYEDREYINKKYIDGKVKELVEDLVDRTSLQKDVDLILKVLDEVICLKNKDYYGYIYHKGFIYMKLKRYEEGIQVLTQIIKEEQCDYITKVQSYECIIKSFDKLEEYEEVRNQAKEELSLLLRTDVEKIKGDEFISLDRKCELILQNCKRALNLSLEPEFWIDYLESLSLDFGEKYEVIIKNQSAYKIIANYNKAIELYDKLIKVKPNCASGYYRKGRAIVLVLRLLNSSKTSLKEAAVVHNLDCFTYSEVIYNLNKAISLKNDNGKYFNLLARTHFEIGEYDKAFSYMEHALEISPDDLYMNLNMVCVYIRKYQYTEAVDFLFKMSHKDMKIEEVRKTFLSKREILNFLMGIFNIYPRQDKIYYIIAYYFYAIDNFQFNKALTFINNALSDVDDERYYLLRAKIYLKENNYEEALKNVEDAIAIDDHYDDAFLIKEKCLKILHK